MTSGPASCISNTIVTHNVVTKSIRTPLLLMLTPSRTVPAPSALTAPPASVELSQPTRPRRAVRGDEARPRRAAGVAQVEARLWSQVQSHTGAEDLGCHGVQVGVGAVCEFGGKGDGSLTRRDVVMVKIGYDAHDGVFSPFTMVEISWLRR